MHLPTLLRAARRRPELSIRAAALLCDVPRSTWGDWESGRATPTTVRLGEVLAALSLDVRLVARAQEPPGESAVTRHLRRSLTQRACGALGEQLDATAAACRHAPRLLTGPAAVGIWVPHVVARGPLPLPRSSGGRGLVPVCLVDGDGMRRAAHAWVKTPDELVREGRAEQWPALLTSARLLSNDAPRDALGRQLPAHRDPDEDREVRDLAQALTWAGRGRIPISPADSRAWRLDAPATLDEALTRHRLPVRNASRRPGPPRHWPT